MKQDEFNYFYLIIFFILCLFFMTSILPEHYPDNENLRQKLISNHHELKYSIQNIFVKSLNFIECNIISDPSCGKKKLGDLNRFLFFIPTFFLIVLTFLLNNYLFKKNANNTDIQNFTMLACLCFPSVLLSITSFSSEASYTLISIFIMLNITSLKKFNVNFVFSIILLIYIYQLDKGNSIVFYFFLLGLIFLSYIRKILSFNLFILIIISMSFVILILEHYIFNFIGEFIFVDKIRGLNEEVFRLNLNNLNLIEILKRYFYFWITLTSFMLPNKIFIISFSIILISYLIISNIKQEKKLSRLKQFFLNKDQQALLLWLIMFPIFMINILPTHAYAKYYLFYFPPIIRLLLNVINIKPFINFIFFALFISIIEYKARLIY